MKPYLIGWAIGLAISIALVIGLECEWQRRSKPKPVEYRHVDIWRDPEDVAVYVDGEAAPYWKVTLEVGKRYTIRVEAKERRTLEYDFWVTEGRYQVIDARPYDLTGHWQGTKATPRTP